MRASWILRSCCGPGGYPAVVIGASAVPWLRFLAIDCAAALVWSAAVAGAGYAFGKGLELWLGDLQRLEELLALALVGAGLLLWWLRLRKRRA